MCGIAGILDTSGEVVSAVLLRRMTEAIAHRGPDGEGSFVDGGIGLGHRRLAILDLSSAGHQPMQTPDGRWVIAYNGEVYNFNELRIELEALGRQFRSKTDTEVVLAAWAEWGVRALERFNGMFAFAVWDRVESTLWLARDRYGIKPLYYAWQGPRLLFGSEVKALVADTRLSRELDPEALLEYFTFQNFFTDRTLLRGVRLLPAGSCMRVDMRGRDAAVTARYWDWSFVEPERSGDEREYVEELDRLFLQAVERQLVSDVEVGAYLSGGMDSGSITAIAARELPYLKTFTCGFDLHSASGLELGFDEREAAEHMSYLFKTEHYEMVLKAGDMERCMGELAWHLEEPRVGQSYPNWYVARLASKFVKVVLGGTGGDEIFGGYPWRYYRAVVNDSFEHYVDKYWEYWQRLLDGQQAAAVFAPIRREVAHVSTRDIFRGVFADGAGELTGPEDYVNHSLYFEAKTFLAGLLIVEDKLSMAHGLEVRVPFLDNDLVDFAQRVPVRLKLGKLEEVLRIDENTPSKKVDTYFQKTRDGKLLLRRMLSRHCPPEVSERVKQGFSAPDSSWFRGESMDYVRRELLGESARIYEWLDRGAVQRLVSEHLEGKANRRLLVWSLLNVEAWCRQYL